MRLIVGLLASSLLLCAPAAAQTGPGPQNLSAVERGVQELNTSGQNGFVRLWSAGPNRARLAVEMHGAPAGRREAVTIHRGRDCDNVSSQAAARGNDLVNGRSTSILPMSEDRLLSGNYSLLIFSGTQSSARPVACAHLYR